MFFLSCAPKFGIEVWNIEWKKKKMTVFQLQTLGTPKFNTKVWSTKPKKKKTKQPKFWLQTLSTPKFSVAPTFEKLGQNEKEKHNHLYVHLLLPNAHFI
jgi:hypothetical protein